MPLFALTASIFKTFKYGGGGLEVVVSGLPEMPLDIKVITNSSRTLCKLFRGLKDKKLFNAKLTKMNSILYEGRI